MNDEPIPLITYVLVTITSFVLAYASIENDDDSASNTEQTLDNAQVDQQYIQKETEELTTTDDVQPTPGEVQYTPDEVQRTSTDIPIANAVPIDSDAMKYGGKKKKNEI